MNCKHPGPTTCDQTDCTCGLLNGSASAVDALVMCDLVCEYCGEEYHGDFKQAVADGWQHGYDASFCPKHNV